jgi:hypothetical protein
MSRMRCSPNVTAANALAARLAVRAVVLAAMLVPAPMAAQLADTAVRPASAPLASTFAPRAQSPMLPPLTECGPLVHAGEAVGFVGFPQGDVFCPRVADPKEPRTFVSLLYGRSPGEPPTPERGALMPLETTIGAIGIGDAFGLARWAGSRPGDGVQLSIAAAVFAQFDLEAASFDLINADYVVALPLTLRRGSFSSRLRVYHQSSHLGDEFLIRDQPERINLSFESVELILSQAIGPLRAYVGGELLFNRHPDDLDARVVHAGIEARARVGRALGLVGTLDVKSTEQQDWKPAWSTRAGLETRFGRDPSHPARRLSLLVEFYDGPSPYGQFYREQLRYWGAGLHLTL